MQERDVCRLNSNCLTPPFDVRDGRLLRANLATAAVQAWLRLRGELKLREQGELHEHMEKAVGRYVRRGRPVAAGHGKRRRH